MPKADFVQENRTHKILSDFDIQMDHYIPTRRPDLVLINKKKRTCHLMDFAVPMDHRVKKRKRKD